MTESYRLVVLGVLSLASMLFILGCATSDDGIEVDLHSTVSFRSQWVHGEGTVVELTGHRTGHLAGEASDFELRLHNPTEQDWRGEYCVALITDNGGVVLVAREAFLVLPDDELQATLHVGFPDGVADSVVGVALIVPGQGTNVVSVEVGNPTPGGGVAWPPNADCPDS